MLRLTNRLAMGGASCCRGFLDDTHMLSTFPRKLKDWVYTHRRGSATNTRDHEIGIDLEGIFYPLKPGKKVITTVFDAQKKIIIRILHGHDQVSSNNLLIGKIEMEDMHPRAAGYPQIELTFEKCEHGILKFTAFDKLSKVKKELVIEPGDDLEYEDNSLKESASILDTKMLGEKLNEVVSLLKGANTKSSSERLQTYDQQPSTISKDNYVVINERACKVVDVSTSQIGQFNYEYHFACVDIFTEENVEVRVPFYGKCNVPYVVMTEYKLIGVSEDGFVSLLSDDGVAKNNVKLPHDVYLIEKIKSVLDMGRNVGVTVVCAMGEEQICSVKDICP